MQGGIVFRKKTHFGDPPTELIPTQKRIFKVNNCREQVAKSSKGGLDSSVNSRSIEQRP